MIHSSLEQTTTRTKKLNIITMNGIETTEGAPVTASNENNTPIAGTKKTARRKATKTTKATPTIVRRKVLAGKHKTTGAPKLEVIGLTTKPIRGAFTLMDIFRANGETISLLTIKKRKNELMKAGKLVKDAEAAKRQHEGHGRPPEYFNFDVTKGEVKKARSRKAKAKGKTSPVVAAEQTPAPAETPAQQPVETASVVEQQTA